LGIDLQWTAIPDGSPLLAMARRGELEDLGFVDGIYEQRPAYRDGDAPGWDLARQIARERPSIRQRTLWNGGRTYETLSWLLSEEFRSVRSQDEMTSPRLRVLWGYSALHAAVVSSIGIPVRYSSPLEVREGLAALAEVTRETLLSAFDEPAMREDAVYKLRSDTPEDRAIVWHDFSRFRELLEAVVRVGDEGLLAARD
jgi:hypothetical protein